MGVFMKIIKATIDEINSVKEITQNTIKAVYPHYYPVGAVDFFLKHHSDAKIIKDISQGCAYILRVGDIAVGTVTINENEINRLFVLPEFQGKGYGSALLDFAESKIAENYSEIILAASLPAKKLYQKRGYTETSFDTIHTDNGDLLCYDMMKKYCKSSLCKINYDGKKFIPKSNSENGEVDASTVFYYHQKDNKIWAEYSGGEVIKGFLIGTVDTDGKLKFNYQHINTDEKIRIGECVSTPEVTENGKLEMYEIWQWLNGDCSKGESVLVEI